MFRKILDSLFLFLAALTTTLVAILCSLNNDMYTYLDATNYVESNASKKFNNGNSKKNEYENSFLTDAFDNYGLYKFNGYQGNYELNSKNFDGNLASYDEVTNDAIDTHIWKNDFAVVNLVIKTKDAFDLNKRIKIEISSEAGENKNLKVQSGYLRYIAATHNSANTEIGFNPGTTQFLQVPDAITDDQEIKMTANNVYIFRIRIDRSADDKNVNEALNLSISYGEKIIDSKQINVIKINRTLPNVKSSDPSFNILSYPNAIPGFYNTGVYKKTGKFPIQYDKTANFDVKVQDPVQFVDWNWNKYWEKEYKYHIDNFGEGSYFYADLLRESKSNSLNWKYDKEGNWTKTDIWNNTSNQNAWFIFKIKNDQIYATDKDWAPFDDYIYKMRKLGYKNLLLDDFMRWGGGTDKWFYEWEGNETTGKWKLVNKYFAQADSKFDKSIFEAWINHIRDLKSNPRRDSYFDNYKYNWVKDFDSSEMTAQFYFDEPNINKATFLLKILNEEKKENPDLAQFLRAYYAIWGIQLGDRYPITDEVKNVDTLYLNSQSMFNYQSYNLADLIDYRNGRGLITGQYQLDSHSDYDLLRAEPGQSAYEMLVLNRQKEPNYMKYIMNAWGGIQDYYDADYGNYAAGDTMWEYPQVSSFNDEKLKDPDVKISADVSVRLEQLAVGVNILNKIKLLNLDMNIVNKYVTPLFTGSRIQSKNKFNFAEDKLDIKSGPFGLSYSYIDSYIKQLNWKYGEVDSVKFVNGLINAA